MRRHVVVVVLALAGCHPPGWGKDDEPALDAATTGDAAGGIDAASGDAAGDLDAAASCTEVFRLEGHGSATAALVTGDFVAWAGTTADGALAMTLGGDAAWTAQRELAPGTYQYRFIVDGNWIVDPANPDQVPNGLGGFNSVLTCP